MSIIARMNAEQRRRAQELARRWRERDHATILELNDISAEWWLLKHEVTTGETLLLRGIQSSLSPERVAVVSGPSDKLLPPVRKPSDMKTTPTEAPA